MTLPGLPVALPALALAAALGGYWLAWLSEARARRQALACAGAVALFFGGLLAFGPTPTPREVALPAVVVLLGAAAGALAASRAGSARRGSR